MSGYDIIEKKRTGKRRHPKKGSDKVRIKYMLKARFEKDTDRIDLERKGKFILATNSFEILCDRNTKVLILLGEPYEKINFLREGCGK
ncbi:MAG: hypothetical protein R6V01_05170 [Thermoplasmatota archaeon]